ncbi:hypothetical protein VNI00_007326 [Paramarasmius palmivorus]|uniref:F-box domain-containing protein n=1 Tax=Paramarasmius palmivorus TaxID=297713 RepID=A0AAW0D4X9_9AGAR
MNQSILPSIVNLPPTTHDHLFRDLSVKELFNYSKVNRAANTAVREFYRRAFRVENILYPYFDRDDIRNFRILQYSFGILIGGSTALAFFQRFAYAGSDLDLYIEIRFCAILGQFLEEAGYQYTPAQFDDSTQATDLADAIDIAYTRATGRREGARTRAERYDLKGMAGVFTFIRDDGKKIEVIGTRANPLEVILGYHSTVVMNLIGYSNAISLYPRSTFMDLVSLKLHVHTRKAEAACSKYQKRGWNMVSFVDAATAVSHDSNLHMFPRFLNDAHCWRVPLLPLDNFTPGPEHPHLGDDDLFMLQSWMIHYEEVGINRILHSEIAGGPLIQPYCLCYRAVEMVESVGCLRCTKDEWTSEEPFLVSLLLDWYRTSNDEQSYPTLKRTRDGLIQAYGKIKTLYPTFPSEALPSATSAFRLHEFLFGLYEDVPGCRVTIQFNSDPGYVVTEVIIDYPVRHGGIVIQHITSESLAELKDQNITLALCPY